MLDALVLDDCLFELPVIGNLLKQGIKEVSVSIRHVDYAGAGLVPDDGDLFAAEPSPPDDLEIYVPVSSKREGQVTVYQPHLKQAVYVKRDGREVTETIVPSKNDPFFIEAIAAIRQSYANQNTPENRRKIRIDLSHG